MDQKKPIEDWNTHMWVLIEGCDIGCNPHDRHYRCAKDNAPNAKLHEQYHSLHGSLENNIRSFFSSEIKSDHLGREETPR